jgi:hypothetical protein
MMMYVDDEGNDGDGRDGDSNSKGNGEGNSSVNGNDAAAAANGNYVVEDDSGNLRTMIGRWQMDGNNGTMSMAECVQVLRHPSKQQSTNVTVWGGGDEREGRFGGIESEKRVKVGLIEWRSVDLCSINSKSTFRPPHGGKHMGTYSVCFLGVRLCYWRLGKHVY